MDMIGLKYFVSAARWLNFTKAADECCITQTAMSLHIAKIEKELEFKLFNRDNRTVSLTPGGKAFLAEATAVLRRYDEGVKKSAAVAAGFEGRLTIGYANYIECSDLPEIVGALRKRRPAIDVALAKNELTAIVDDLEHGLTDLAVVFPYDALAHPGIAVARMETYPIRVFLRRDHRLSGSRRIKLAALRNETIIVRRNEGSPNLYSQVQDDWRSLDFRPKEVIEVDSADSILFLVEAGFGCALMPSYVDRMMSDKVEAIELEEERLRVELCLAYMRDNDNPALRQFLEFLETEKAERG